MVHLFNNELFLQFYRNDDDNYIKRITLQIYGISRIIKLNKDKLLIYIKEFNIYQLYEE